MNINWKAYFTGLLTAGTLAFIGGVWDFQNVKAQVSNLEKKTKKTDATLKAIGRIVCMYAVRDGLPNADDICKDVLQ